MAVACGTIFTQDASTSSTKTIITRIMIDDTTPVICFYSSLFAWFVASLSTISLTPWIRQTRTASPEGISSPETLLAVQLTPSTCTCPAAEGLTDIMIEISVFNGAGTEVANVLVHVRPVLTFTNTPEEGEVAA